jgi:hypothetical protein
VSWRWVVLGLLIALVTAPVLWRVSMGFANPFRHWSEARWDSAGLAPDPATTPGAVVQVYAARAWGWKGIFAVHTWLIMKREGADRYDRYEVVGWGVRHGRPAVRKDMRAIDGYWAGNPPRIVVDRRGPEVGALIERIEAAIASYPYPDQYRSWPGPNSNTFTAHIARSVPELGLELPPTAIEGLSCQRQSVRVDPERYRLSDVAARPARPVAQPRRGPGAEPIGADARHRSARRGDQAAGGRPHRPVLGGRHVIEGSPWREASPRPCAGSTPHRQKCGTWRAWR